MKRRFFLSPIRRRVLAACMSIAIAVVFLSAAGLARAQSPVNLSIGWFTRPSPIRLGDGQDVEFQFGVLIDSRRAASGVVVTAELPAGLIFSSAIYNTIHSKGVCDFADGLITCNLGTVGMEGVPFLDFVASVDICAKPTEAGTFALTARITANEPDPNLANNTAVAMATVNPPKSRKRVRFL